MNKAKEVQITDEEIRTVAESALESTPKEQTFGEDLCVSFGFCLLVALIYSIILLVLALTGVWSPRTLNQTQGIFVMLGGFVFIAIVGVLLQMIFSNRDRKRIAENLKKAFAGDAKAMNEIRDMDLSSAVTLICDKGLVEKCPVFVDATKNGSPWERVVYAKHGYFLSEYVNDIDPFVRREVAEQGYGLNVLCMDSGEDVANKARDMLYQYSVERGQSNDVNYWMQNNPDKVA